MIVSKIIKPNIIQVFENLLWVNTPTDWVFKTTYFQETLFVSMLINTDESQKCLKIRRSYLLSAIKDRTDDIVGLARDCVDEMKTELV